MAQCVNADFSEGNFTGWTGTYSAGQCAPGGVCSCSPTNPLNSMGFNQGPNNSPLNDTATEYSQVITTSAAAIDSNLASVGYNLPVVWPGGSGYAARMGTMWQSVEAGNNLYGDGETMSYTFVVTPGNCNFTYHYAVVLEDGGHAPDEQPYFSVKMMDGNNNEITCAGYDVNATTCQTIGGFTIVPLIGPNNVYYKPWASVLVPLVNYIGQTITITFTTRGCLPDGCAGDHYGYAYFSCDCAPASFITFTPGNGCQGPNPKLTAPAGLATYSWIGPGINSSPDSQTISIKQPGLYTVVMTTLGNDPCNIAYDTLVPDTLGFFLADFSVSTSCLDSTSVFTDLSVPYDSITSWAWSFNNNGVTDATTENTSYTFPGIGTYPVKLTITSLSCTVDTIINVTVVSKPIATITPVVPVCEGYFSTVFYSVNDTNAINFTYNWNFDSATLAYDSAFGAYIVLWQTGGTKNITLTVVDSNCSALPVTAQAVVSGPLLTLTNDTGICLGSSIILTANGAITYTWAADPTLSATTTSSVTATPDSTDTYYVTGALNGCQATDSVTVQVNTVPVVSLIASDSVCANDTAQITYTGNAAGNAAYIWNFDGAVVDSGGGSGPYLLSWPTAGIRHVTLTVVSGGCISPLSTVPVTVKAAPALTLIGDSAACLGNQITLTATGASAYVWAVDTLLYTTDSITISPDSSTTFIAVTGTTNGCSTTDSVSITGNANPVVSFVTSGLVCVGDTITVTFTGSAVAGATFNWNFGYGNANTLTGAGPISVSWDSIGFCPVSLTVSQYGCVSNFADTIPVQICSGIALVNSSQISIYPNPAKNDFTIEVNGAINNGQLQIYDVLGQVLYAEEMNTTSGYSKQIHLNVATGVYFVSVREGDKHYTQKLIIE